MADAVLQSGLLAEFAGLEHGFGTRHAPGWPPESAAELEQSHSAVVLEAPAGTAGRFAAGDALFTAAAGMWLVVRTADCLPILIADPEHPAVAAVHAGWRGSAAGIAVAAVELLMRRFGTPAHRLVAAIGPGIGPCCYEVGAEVAGLFSAWVNSRQERRLDLAEVNRRQLLACGLQDGRIEILRRCTRCEADSFFSYRREPGEARRMRSGIRIRAEG